MSKFFLSFQLATAGLLLAWSTACCQPRTLVILHTNDMHACYLPHRAERSTTEPKPLMGGFEALKIKVDSVRATAAASLLLDAGDIMTGNPIADWAYRGARGGALFEMMNLIGYDAWCPGNHEFDISSENASSLAGIAAFPALCANLVDREGRRPAWIRPFLIDTVNGVRVGIIGVETRSLYHLIRHGNLSGLKVLPPGPAVQKCINELRGLSDLVIALTHEGVDDDSVLATRVAGLDVIVGGHSHTILRKPKLVNGVVIVQAGARCENLGVLSLTIEQHRVISFAETLLPLWPRSRTGGSSLTDLVDSIQAEVGKEYGEVIGTLQGDWMRTDTRGSLGQFVADAVREAAGADIGFMNDQGMRKDVAEGPLTRLDIYELLPHGDVLATFLLTGSRLRVVLKHLIEKNPGTEVAGFTCLWKKGAGGGIILEKVMVGGRDLEEGRSYKCAAGDYLVGEAGHYLGIDLEGPVFSSETVRGAAERAVRERRTISAFVEPSIAEVP